jgi:hypothetical protein
MNEIFNRCYEAWKNNWRNEVIPPYQTPHSHEFIYNRENLLVYGIIVNEKPHGIWWLLRKNDFDEYVILYIYHYNNGLLDGNCYSYGDTQSIKSISKYVNGVSKKNKYFETTKYIGRCGLKEPKVYKSPPLLDAYLEDIEKYYPIPDVFKNIIPKNFQNLEICEEKYYN